MNRIEKLRDFLKLQMVTWLFSIIKTNLKIAWPFQSQIIFCSVFQFFTSV